MRPRRTRRRRCAGGYERARARAQLGARGWRSWGRVWCGARYNFVLRAPTCMKARPVGMRSLRAAPRAGISQSLLFVRT